MHTSRNTVLATSLMLAACLNAACLADETPRPFLHPVFSDNMVLQRNQQIPVWGWTAPGERISASIQDHTTSTTADASGRWELHLPKMRHGGPYNLSIKGPTSTTLTNVLIGDVWLCSGQSNMEMGIGEVRNAQTEIKNARYDHIRLLSIPKKIASEPQETFNGRWKTCTPENIVQGDYNGFSAAGFFFGRDLHMELGVPIGLIDSTWGGTVAEAWTSASALQAMPDFKPAVERLEEIRTALASGTLDWDQLQQQWFESVDPGSSNLNWASPELDSSTWPDTTIPGYWDETELGNFDGIVWFRREFNLPNGWEGQAAYLHIGPIDDRDATFVNGTLVGTTDIPNPAREYKIPAGVLQAGRNVIAIRVLDTGGRGGIYGKADQLHLDSAGDARQSSVNLAGSWRYHRGPALSKTGQPPRRLDSNPNEVTVLYNGMIAPLLPFPIRGAIWYQGESNANRAAQYQRLLPTMIQDWRSRFNVGSFPFLIVQLANFMAVDQQPSESDWAELREAQFLTTQTTPNTGLALAIDIGEANDIHPRNKQEVGRRLALTARALAYHQDLPYSGPVFRSMRQQDHALRLRFNHVYGSLNSGKETALNGFALAGADGKFVWANARIEGHEVVVESPLIPDPVHVRYGWGNNPNCNLYNQAGLPAVPFRTDHPE
ncbi:MAG: sialate O-acetylesterase [Limisphaerales bacterium]